MLHLYELSLQTCLFWASQVVIMYLLARIEVDHVEVGIVLKCLTPHKKAIKSSRWVRRCRFAAEEGAEGEWVCRAVCDCLPTRKRVAG